MRHILPLKYIDAVAKAGSIRAAAEELSITASALNRRILAMEQELGVEIFERHSTGVYLNSAGEILIQHIRTQMADLERVKSRIADLSGLRLGHVRIAATRETTRYFLPRQILKYRDMFPGVTFDVNGMNRDDVERRLVAHDADIMVAFQPQKLAEVHTLIHARQDIQCLVSVDHPLAKERELRLADCIEYNLLLSPKGEGVRQLVEAAMLRKGLKCNPVIESNDPAFLERVAMEGGGVAFAIPIAISAFHAERTLKSIPLKQGEVEPGFLFVGQLRNRTLSVAAAKFVEEMRKAIEV